MKAAVRGLVGAIVCACGGMSFAQDGVYWSTGNYDRFWSSSEYWRETKVAKEGGVATLGEQKTMQQNVSGLELGGIVFNGDIKGTKNSNVGFFGNKITFVGSSFLSGTGSPVINLTMDGKDGNTLTKRGSGTITLGTSGAFGSNLGEVSVVAGTLASIKTSGDAFPGAPVSIDGGTLAWKPASSSGDDAAATISSLTAGRGKDVLSMDKGSGASATLTVNALSLEAGASLVVKSKANDLGETEKVNLATAPTLVNGIVDPRIVTRAWSVTPWQPWQFLTYDAAKGFVPFADYVDFASAGSTDIARATGSISMTDDKTVGSLVLEDMSGNITIASGKTLTIGNNEKPAAFHMNFSSADNTLAKLSGGSIDFGTSPGIFRRSPSAGSNQRNFQIETTIKGSAGVTYETCNDADGLGETYVYFGQANTAGYTGPTHFIGLRAYVRANGAFPSGGDVWIHSGASMWSWTAAGGSRTYDQHFHFAGEGYSSGGALLLYQTAAAGTSAEFTGGLTLERDTYFKSSNAGDVGTFTCAVDGPGGLQLGGPGHFQYKAVNTYGGETELADSVTLSVQGTGTLGAGDVTAAAGTMLAFDGTTGLLVTNDIASSGVVSFENAATVRFDGEASFASASFVDAKAGAPVVTVGGMLALGAASGSAVDTATVRAAAGGGTVKLAGEGEVRVNLADGEGPLSVVKTGDGTLTLAGKKTYTGTTKVEGGTLRLANAAFRPTDISGNVYWLDASQEATVFTDDVTGLVTNWVSASGNGVAFGNPVYESKTEYRAFPGPGYTNTVNGLKTVSFSCADPNRMAAIGQSVEQRTVFIVLQQQDFVPYMEIFGVEAGSYGIFSYQTLHKFQSGYTSAKYMTDGVLGWNGVKTTDPGYAKGTTYVMTAVREEYHDETSVNATFVPAIGGYSGVGARNFGGEVGEVIAYSRVLTDDERALVENYLSEKWRAKSCHDDVVNPKDGPVLAAASSLELAHGATLDLNGTTQTVASVTGEGVIDNSSATPAVLNVTGGGSFKGTVRGNVILNRTAAGASELDVTLEGAATLNQAGGITKLVPYNQLPTTDGLACWLDASAVGSVILDESDNVTNWTSRATGAVAGYAWTADLFSNATPPQYDADGFNGKPCVYFNDATDSLKASASVCGKTVFVVGARDGAAAENANIWGCWSSDLGFRYAKNSYLRATHPSYTAYLAGGETLHKNGTAVSLTGNSLMDVSWPATYCLTARLAAGNTKVGAAYHALGHYKDSSAVQRIAEVLVYDRCLADDEIADVETYLMGKWGIAGTEPVANDVVLKGTGTVSLSDGATVDLDGSSIALPSLKADGTGGTIRGNVTLNGNFTVDAQGATTIAPYVVDGDLTIGSSAVATVLNWQNLEKGPFHEALKATGTATGDFAGVEGIRPNLWLHRGNTWGLLRSLGTLLIVR